MMKLFALAAALSLPCAPALSQQTLVAGYIQKVSYQPRGSDAYPDPCPPGFVCVRNGGASIESIELKVEQDVRGESPRGAMRSFAKVTGEWGPVFPVTSRLIVVHQDGQQLRWTPAVLRNGQVHVVPDSFRHPASQAGLDWIEADTPGVVPLDAEAARLGLAKP